MAYEFDTRNRLKEVRAKKTGDVADQVTTYGYTDAGARDRQTHPNGTTVKYIYNPRHQLKEMLHKTAAGVLLLGITYQLDASGLRTEIAETGQTTRVSSYEYDAQKRLKLESVKASPTGAFIRSQGYEYDPVGNRLVETKTVGTTVETTTSTYDRNDRLKTAVSTSSTVTYQYDANGRLESQITAPASGATTTVAYGWDSRDRMTSSTSTSGTQSSTTKFSYDPDGTRIGQTQNAGTPQAKTIRYLVDRNQPYAQVVEERVFAGEATAPNMGALTNIYAFGDDLLTNTSCGAASTESNCAAADLRVLHYDGLGSTRFLSDGNGATTDKYAYEAFGELDDSGSSGGFANNYKFTGEQLDPGLGFYYLRARYFNPGTGGFVSMDSFEGNGHDPISLNKYLYAGDSPAMFTDPSGNISMGEITVTNLTEGILSSVNTYSRISQVYGRVKSVTDLLFSLQQLPNLINSIGALDIGSVGSSIGKYSSNELKHLFEQSAQDLAENVGKIIAEGGGGWTPGFISDWVKGGRIKTWYLEMPKFLHGSFGRTDIPTGLKISGAPVKLTFGALRKGSGRMMGLGLDMNGRKTLFQQHYHLRHETRTQDDFAIFSSGQFHYHMKTWNRSNQGP